MESSLWHTIIRYRHVRRRKPAVPELASIMLLVCPPLTLTQANPLQGHLSVWPFSCCKTVTPILLRQVGMMGAVIWQQLQSHTGYAKLLSPYKSVAQPVALQQQISPITVSVADPPITVSAADLPIIVCHPLMFSATVPP